MSFDGRTLHCSTRHFSSVLEFAPSGCVECGSRGQARARFLNDKSRQDARTPPLPFLTQVVGSLLRVCGRQTGTTPQNHHLYPFSMYATTHADHKRAHKSWRSDAPIILPGLVGPGRNPQYTRAWLAREAVGCSQNNHHKAPPRQPMSQTTLLTRR